MCEHFKNYDGKKITSKIKVIDDGIDIKQPCLIDRSLNQ